MVVEVEEVDAVDSFVADVVDEEVGRLEVPDSKDLEFSFLLKSDSVEGILYLHRFHPFGT